MLYRRMAAWFSVEHLERRIALIALVFTLPSLWIGLQSDDYILRAQLLERGPFAAYVFTPQRGPAGHAQILAQRSAGYVPWWNDEYAHARFLRPLASLSLWLDFAFGAPPWAMHLENCLIYAAIAWLAAAVYRQFGLSGAGLGWAALFFGLDLAFAAPAGWIAGRNTLFAAGFGFACILLHARARQSGKPALLALACACFVLSLLSAELGLCTFGYVLSHALMVDRAPLGKRVLVLVPYAALVALYLAYYVSAGYGASSSGGYIDVFGAPALALLTWIGSVPVWLASTATLPYAGFVLFEPNARLYLIVASVAVLGLFLPLWIAYLREQPSARTFGAAALLSLVPLAATLPQERLRFFVALGVYGVLGPWVVSAFEAQRWTRRVGARVVWAIHAVLLPLFFIPTLFAVKLAFASGGADALDRAVPRARQPITIVLNPPNFFGPLYQGAMRVTRGEARPPVFMLYAGTEAVEIERLDARTLEMHAAGSWFSTPLTGFRDLTRWPFRVGERIALAHLGVEVIEVDGRGAPTRTRFTFDRPLDDPGLTFLHYDGADFSTWTPPAAGGHQEL